MEEGRVNEFGGVMRGRRRGTRNRDRLLDPSEGGPVRASATATLLSVALENHLKPFREYCGPSGLPFPKVLLDNGVAVVSVWDTSEPPGLCVTVKRVKTYQSRYTS